MSSLPPRHLLIPYAAPDAPACRQALAALHLPNLEALLSKLVLQHDDRQPADTLSPPHERALAAALGIAAPDGCIPWAALEARRRQLGPTEAGESWGFVTLCHWQVGMDSVRLGDPASIEIDAAESDALLAAARPFFEEDGIALHPGSTPGRWLACGPVFDALPTASIDRAVEGPLAQWMPDSEAARPLRRLQNEMQMLLYTQRVNDDRAARGAVAINSFWLSGTGHLPTTHVAVDDTAAPLPTVVDSLRGPALGDDGAAWAAAWAALDCGPVAALRAAQADGAEVMLTLCGDRAAQRWVARPRGLASWARGLLQRAPAIRTLEAL
ncbi:MAG: hypothetical protein EOP81_13340 [Variovorax sp.]|nr:MAG: hypothetical protein EOP81_13340 [Variovorax sp.]